MSIPPNLIVLKHPLIQHKLTIMRKSTTVTAEFRTLLKEISLLMGYELTRDLALTTVKIETPMTVMEKAPILAGKKLAIVPILRAGIAMSEGLLELIPLARVGHIGMYRNEVSKEAIHYLVKLPKLKNRRVIITDPMLATGNSMTSAIKIVKERGVENENIKILSLVSAPEGVKRISEVYPNIMIYTASLDDMLDENAYILPGLGDAGDRIFGTK